MSISTYITHIDRRLRKLLEKCRLKWLSATFILDASHLIWLWNEIRKFENISNRHIFHLHSMFFFKNELENDQKKVIYLINWWRISTKIYRYTYTAFYWSAPRISLTTHYIFSRFIRKIVWFFDIQNRKNFTRKTNWLVRWGLSARRTRNTSKKW